ncbi:MAG: Ig-like domain-containing protein [Actinomycetota bacterium]
MGRGAQAMLTALLSRARRAVLPIFAVMLVALLFPPGHAIAGGTKGNSGGTKGNCRKTSTCTTADTVLPSVSIASPSNGATVGGTVTFSGTASDNVAVASVAISVDGGSYAAATGTTSWSFSLNTTTLADGSHTVSARATDTSGNKSSVSESITTSNSAPSPSPSPTASS